jgi:manganese/zinc/iron transport system permease protein
LFLALLVGPVLIAFRYTASLKKIIGLSFLISSLCSLVAVALSRHILSSYQIAISTSGLVVTLLLIVALISWGFSIKKGAFCKKMDPKNTNRAI